MKFSILLLAAACLPWSNAAHAQTTAVSWNRQAYGQLEYIPGHEGDPAFSYHYADNDAWSQHLIITPASGNRPAYITQPSNWSTPDFPNGDAFDVTLNSTTTNLDRGVGGPISVNSLTIGPAGFLNMEAGTAITIKSFFEIQKDGELTNAGGGGMFPVINLPASSTLIKSYGAGTYDLVGNIVLNAAPGAHITSASGILQLPGNSGLLDGVVFTAASGAIIDLVGKDPGTGANSAKAQHTFTAAAATGTVRLSANALVGNRDYSQPVESQTPLIFDFPGTVFQWTGGYLGAYQGQNPVTNMGVMNLAGTNSRYLFATLTNNGSIIHTDAGSLELSQNSSGGTLINAAGGTYELRGDASINSGGYQPFNNLGLLRKSAGVGTSTLNALFNNTGGTVQVDSGTLQIGDASGAQSTGGTFNVAAGATFDLGSGGTYLGTYTGSGAGMVRLSHGQINGSPTAPGTTFNLSGGGFQWTSGVFGAYQGFNLLTNAGVLTMAGPDAKISYAVFTNSGSIVHSGAGDFLLGENSSTGSFDNAASGVYDLQSDAGIGGGRVFTNEGLLEKTAGAGTSTVDSQFTNTGTVVVRSGTLAFTGNVVKDGTLGSGEWQVADGATLTLPANSGITTNQGDVTLAGANASFLAISGLADNQGRFALDGQRLFTTVGDLRSSGTLDIGAGSTLHVAGSLTLVDPSAQPGAREPAPIARAVNRLATLAIAIGGAAHDGQFSAGAVQVDGAATLAGNIALRLAEGFKMPTEADTITIISSGKPLQGAFANAADGAAVDAGNGVSFRVRYLANSVVLKLASAAPIVPSNVTLAVKGTGFATESGGKGKAVLTRDGDLTQDLAVTLQIKGSAKNGSDYETLSTTAVIPAGAGEFKLKVKPREDGAAEGPETVIIKLLPSSTGAYTVGKPKKATITILDND